MDKTKTNLLKTARQLELLRVAVHLIAERFSERNGLQRQPQIAGITLLLQELLAHVTSLLQRCQRNLLLSLPRLLLGWLSGLTARVRGPRRGRRCARIWSTHRCGR